MIYHPDHFHGISHESDMDWLFNLPVDTQILIGDGKTTKHRLKYEARLIAMHGGTTGINPYELAEAIGCDETQEVMSQFRMLALLDLHIDDDSHYVVSSIPLRDGQQYMVKYHYVSPL